MLNIVVCDDDLNFTVFLEKMITKQLGSDCTVTKFSSGYAVEIFVENNNGDIDILFMDISLCEHNGIDISKIIKAKYPKIEIIFVTGHLGYFQDIFQTEPTYFLLKPITEAKLNQALTKARENLALKRKNTICLGVGRSMFSLPISDIQYIESAARLVFVHTAGECHKYYGRLSDIMLSLPCHFFRCHQSFIINMSYIERMNATSFLLLSGKEIPISHGRYKDSRAAFLNYLKEQL